MLGLKFRDGLGKNTDRDVDPVKWNQAWDRHLERKFALATSFPDVTSLLGSDLSGALGQQFLVSLEAIRKDLCTLQYDLAMFMIDKRAEDNFDARWLALPAQEREAHITEGLLVSSGAVADMENRRENCPETSMQYLQEDGGKGFLSLLTTYCPLGQTSAELRSEPIFVSHPVYDAMYGIGKPCPPGQNAAARAVFQRYSSTVRNYFLTFFLWNTILHFYGQSQTYGASKHGGEKRSMRENKDMVDGMVGKQRADKIRQETTEALATAQWDCANCRIPQHLLPDGKKFLECSRCRAIGRKIHYCDKQCQTNDWKNGSPPHKTTCGKPHSVPPPITTTPVQPAAAVASPPVATPRPAQSAALQHQLSLLAENPQMDYVLVEPDPKPDTGVVFPHPNGRTLFKMAKQRAIDNGEPNAVALMYKCLLPSAQNAKFSPARLLLQLSKEYGIAVDVLSKLVEQKDDEETRRRQAEVDRRAEEIDRKMGIRT